MNARLDGVNAELSDKKKMSTAALIDALHGLILKMDGERRELIDELYNRHVVRPLSNLVLKKDIGLFTSCPVCETRIDFKTRLPHFLEQLVRWIKCEKCLSEYMITIRRKNQDTLSFGSIQQKISPQGEKILEERKQKPPSDSAQTKGVEDAKPN